jgi:3',5'-cyclic-AMP phosphodiesterase
MTAEKASPVAEVAYLGETFAHQVCLDLAADAPSAWVLEPPGLRLFAWREGGPVVGHLMPIGHFDGPYPFHDDAGLID